MPRIALIHAVPVAIDPVRDAFAELWPEAETVNILDDSLSPDRAKDADLTPEMHRRIGDLGRYALRIRADGVLYTCSAFEPAIEAFAGEAGRPVLKPNEAMFDEALAAGRQIGMLATFGPSVASMEVEFRAAAAGRDATIETVLVEDAMAALRRGDAEAHNRLLVEGGAATVRLRCGGARPLLDLSGPRRGGGGAGLPGADGAGRGRVGAEAPIGTWRGLTRGQPPRGAFRPSCGDARSPRSRMSRRAAASDIRGSRLGIGKGSVDGVADAVGRPAMLLAVVALAEPLDQHGG